MSELRVLVVDDQPDVVESLTSCVKQWGHHVESAYSGEEALTKVEGFEPHVVLLDIMMPDMDGYTVATKLRRMGHTETTIVGVTALQADEHRHKSWDNGFHFYLVKPVNPDRLRKLLAGFERTISVEEKARTSGIAALTRKLSAARLKNA